MYYYILITFPEKPIISTAMMFGLFEEGKEGQDLIDINNVHVLKVKGSLIGQFFYQFLYKLIVDPG
jgi:hypothetical protein